MFVARISHNTYTMKLLYTIFYNYIRWFEKVHFSEYKIISSAFFFMAMLLILAVCAIADAITSFYKYQITQDLRIELILIISVIIFGSLYFILLFNGKAKNIIERKPKLFNSEGLSVFITLLYTILCFSTILLVG